MNPNANELDDLQLRTHQSVEITQVEQKKFFDKKVTLL
jgi:hypothetical protein